MLIILRCSPFGKKNKVQWLEHSDTKMTANIYSHLDMTRKLDMANKLGSRIGT